MYWERVVISIEAVLYIGDTTAELLLVAMFHLCSIYADTAWLILSRVAHRPICMRMNCCSCRPCEGGNRVDW
jgi:hypothetical protein